MKVFKEFRLGLVLFVFLLGSIIFAIPMIVQSQIGTIEACVRNSNGSVRIVSSLNDCNGNETPYSWNTEGPQGPPGPPGASGLQLMVIDSMQNEVGAVLDSVHVVRYSGSYWVRFNVNQTGINQSDAPLGQIGNVQMLYLTSNCSGTPYVQTGGPLRSGYASGTDIYYAADPVQFRTFLSRRNSPPGNPGPCTFIDNPGFTALTGPMESMDVSGLVPPFTTIQSTP